MLDALLSTRPDAAMLIARLILAGVIFPHGLQKVFGWFGGPGIRGSLGYFHSLGIPTPLGVLAVAAEFLGPIALALGLFGRVAALAIGGVMITAAVLVHQPNGFFMNWYGNHKGEGFEYHLLALGLVLVLVVRGSGAASLDLALAGR